MVKGTPPETRQPPLSHAYVVNMGKAEPDVCLSFFSFSNFVLRQTSHSEPSVYVLLKEVLLPARAKCQAHNGAKYSRYWNILVTQESCVTDTKKSRCQTRR